MPVDQFEELTPYITFMRKVQTPSTAQPPPPQTRSPSSVQPSRESPFPPNVRPPVAPIIAHENREFPLAGSWRRFWARTLDFFVLTMPASILLGIALGYLLPPGIAMILSLLLSVIGPLLAEAAIYGIFGNTLGKALLRIRVSDNAGARLDVGAYFQRLFRVLWYGLGLGLPVVNLFTMAYQHGKVRKGGSAGYDEGKYIVTGAPIGVARSVATAAIFLIAIMTHTVLYEVSKKALIGRAEMISSSYPYVDNKNHNQVEISGSAFQVGTSKQIAQEQYSTQETPSPDVVSAASRSKDQAEAEINAVWKALPKDIREALRPAQREFNSRKEQRCEEIASRSRGAERQALATYECWESEYRNRTAELRDIAVRISGSSRLSLQAVQRRDQLEAEINRVWRNLPKSVRDANLSVQRSFNEWKEEACKAEAASSVGLDRVQVEADCWSEKYSTRIRELQAL